MIRKVSKREYIELSSAYRNRKEYPYPSSFEINVGQKGQKQYSYEALDPVCDSQTVVSFKGNVLPAVSGTMTGVPSAPVLSVINTDYSLIGGRIQNTQAGHEEQTIVITYDKFSKRVGVFPPFSNVWDPNDSFGFIDPSTNQYIFLTGGAEEEGRYVGMLLYDVSINEYRTIVKYKNHILHLDSAFGGGWTIDDEYQILTSRIQSTNTAVNVTSSTVQLDPTETADYTHKFIRLYNQNNPPPEGPQTTALITSYNAPGKIATAPKLNTTGLTNPITYEILPFSKDAASFLNYVGFENSGRNLYRITLNSLILPNITLDNSIGGTIAFYPYVYVVFKNKSIGTKSLINSNNPNSVNAAFRVPIIDVPAKELTNFVRLSSSMVNIFEFNVYEPLIFEVLLPDGSLFKTVQQDTETPIFPNEDVQISCNVCLERITN